LRAAFSNLPVILESLLNDVKLNFTDALDYKSFFSTNLKRKSGVIKREMIKPKNTTIGRKYSKNFIVVVGAS
jgi:hypothetical protein